MTEESDNQLNYIVQASRFNQEANNKSYYPAVLFLLSHRFFVYNI